MCVAGLQCPCEVSRDCSKEPLLGSSIGPHCRLDVTFVRARGDENLVRLRLRFQSDSQRLQNLFHRIGLYPRRLALQEINVVGHTNLHGLELFVVHVRICDQDILGKDSLNIVMIANHCQVCAGTSALFSFALPTKDRGTLLKQRAALETMPRPTSLWDFTDVSSMLLRMQGLPGRACA